MLTYKFTGVVSDSGNIQIPEETLFGQEVEIIVVAKNQAKEQKMTATAFVNKWAGFLSNEPEAEYSIFGILVYSEYLDNQAYLVWA